MQITHVEVIPVDLHLRVPYRTRYQDEGELEQVTVIFVRLETQQGQTAWGCAASTRPSRAKLAKPSCAPVRRAPSAPATSIRSIWNTR